MRVFPILPAILAAPLAAEEQDAERRALGPVEIRVQLKDVDGHPFPHGEIRDVTVLVEPVTAGRAAEWGRRRSREGRRDERTMRQIEMEWVGEDEAKAFPKAAARQTERNETGYVATMSFAERAMEDIPPADGEKAEKPAGGYYRAVYDPAEQRGFADPGRRVVAFGALLYFSHGGLTRTIGDFRYPQAEAPAARKGEAELERELQALERHVREGEWAEAEAAADRFDEAIGPARTKLRADVDDLRRAVHAQDRDDAVRKVDELRKGVARLDGAEEGPARDVR